MHLERTMNGSLTNTQSIVERSIMLVTPSSETPSALFTWSPMKAHNIQEQQGRLRTHDHETTRLSLFRGHNYETLITRWMHPRHRRAASLESGELSRVMQQPLRYTRWCRFVGVRSFIHAYECYSTPCWSATIRIRHLPNRINTICEFFSKTVFLPPMWNSPVSQTKLFDFYFRRKKLE